MWRSKRDGAQKFMGARAVCRPYAQPPERTHPVQQGSETLNLEQALGVLRRRLPLIVLCVVVVAGAAYGYSKHQTKQYTATASLAFGENSLSQQIAGLPATSSNNLVAQQNSNLELVRLGDMAAKTASQLGHGLTEERVAGDLSIAGAGESNVVDVSATATSPALASAIANTYVRQFVKEQQISNRLYFKSALTLVNKQLAALSPRQRVGPDGVELQDRAQTLGLLAELNYGNVQVAQEALPPTSPSSPKTSRNTALGLPAGSAHRPRSRLRARAPRPSNQGAGGLGSHLSPSHAWRSPQEQRLFGRRAAYRKRADGHATSGGRGVQSDPRSPSFLQRRSRPTNNSDRIACTERR